MQITIEVTDFEFDEITKNIIKDCLEIDSDKELDIALEKLCKSAFMEYIKMFKERGLPNRADEVKQERLFQLLVHYFQDHMPQESEISTIFQITLAQSRTLLRNTNSRFRTLIMSYLKNSLQSILESAIFNEDTKKYELIIQSKVFYEEFITTINNRGPDLTQLRRVPNSASRYECTDKTFNLLAEYYEVVIK